MWAGYGGERVGCGVTGAVGGVASVSGTTLIEIFLSTNKARQTLCNFKYFLTLSPGQMWCLWRLSASKQKFVCPPTPTPSSSSFPPSLAQTTLGSKTKLLLQKCQKWHKWKMGNGNGNLFSSRPKLSSALAPAALPCLPHAQQPPPPPVLPTFLLACLLCPLWGQKGKCCQLRNGQLSQCFHCWQIDDKLPSCECRSVCVCRLHWPARTSSVTRSSQSSPYKIFFYCYCLFIVILFCCSTWYCCKTE